MRWGARNPGDDPLAPGRPWPKDQACGYRECRSPPAHPARTDLEPTLPTLPGRIAFRIGPEVIIGSESDLSLQEAWRLRDLQAALERLAKAR